MKLICVDDDPAILAVLKVSLETVGDHEVLTANSGQDALSKFVEKSAECDCFLLDIQMPGMNGIEAMKAMRDFERRHHKFQTPIIALTANAMKHQVEQYLFEGFDGHIPKPLDLNILIGEINRVTSTE